MKYLFLISFLYPVILFGQNEQTEKLLKLHERYLDTSNYDSIVVNSQLVIELDSKIAKENQLDYYLAYAAFQTKDYELGIKETRKFIPVIHTKVRTREGSNKNRMCRDLCFQLANYYEQTENYRKAYHNLSLIDRKYNHLFCCICRHSWQTNLYNRMIDCSTKLGKSGRAKRLEKKLEKLNTNENFK